MSPHPLPGFQLDHQYNTFPIHCPCSLSHSLSSPFSIQPNPIMFLDHLKASSLSFYLVKSQLLPRVELVFHKLLVSPATTPSPSPKQLSSHTLESWDKVFIPWIPFLPALRSEKLLLILFFSFSTHSFKCQLRSHILCEVLPDCSWQGDSLLLQAPWVPTTSKVPFTS